MSYDNLNCKLQKLTQVIMQRLMLKFKYLNYDIGFLVYPYEASAYNSTMVFVYIPLKIEAFL